MRCEISYATHQVTHFCNYPNHTNGAAIEHLDIYLCRTRNNELILDTNCAKSFGVYADTDFYRNWYWPTARNDPPNEKS